MPFIIEIERYNKDTRRYSFLSERVDCTLPDYKAAQKFETVVNCELNRIEDTSAYNQIKRTANAMYIQYDNGWVEIRLVPISGISILGRLISGYTTRRLPFHHDPAYRIPDESNCSIG